MNIKQKAGLLFIGAGAGFLSGLFDPLAFGVRGGLFGGFLTLAVILMEGRPLVLRSLLKATLLPALATGLLIYFFPPPDMDMGFSKDTPRLVAANIINCLWFIPCLAYLFYKYPFKSALWRMLLAGMLSAVIRMLGMIGELEILLFCFLPYLSGTVPFIVLWMVFVTLARRWMTKMPPGIQPAWPAGGPPAEPRAL